VTGTAPGDDAARSGQTQRGTWCYQQVDGEMVRVWRTVADLDELVAVEGAKSAAKATATLNDDWHKFIDGLNGWFAKGGRLVLETEDRVFGPDPRREPSIRRAADRLLGPDGDGLLDAETRRGIEFLRAFSS
jgi:hypothetical protein